MKAVVGSSHSRSSFACLHVLQECVQTSSNLAVPVCLVECPEKTQILNPLCMRSSLDSEPRFWYRHAAVLLKSDASAVGTTHRNSEPLLRKADCKACAIARLPRLEPSIHKRCIFC